MNEDTDYKQDIKINRFALEKEVEEQPTKYLFYSEEQAEAKRKRDRKKDKLDQILANEEMRIRWLTKVELVEEFGIDKLTETSIKAAVTGSQVVIDAKKEYSEASHRQMLTEGHARAFEQRKSALDNLVRLWIAGYYSDPTGTKTRNDDIEKQSKRNLNRKGAES